MPKFTVTKGPLKDQIFSFGGEVIFVGRSSENDIQLKVGQVSRKHFKIYKMEKKLFVEDLNSKNGTFVNGEMIVSGKGVEIKENDTISIANTELKLTGLPVVRSSQESDSDFVSEQSKAKFSDRRGGDRKNLDLIWGVTELLRQSMGIDDILQKVLGYVMDSLPRIDTAVIALFDQMRGEIWDTVSKVKDVDEYQKEIEYSRETVEKVIRDRKSIRMSDMKFELPEEITDSITEYGIKSIMCVPMISSDKMIGAIYVDSRGPYGFRKDDLLLLNSLSGPVAVAVEKAILAATLDETM